MNKIKNLNESVTVNDLMDYVEGQLKKAKFSSGQMKEIISGLWAEKVCCTVRDCLMFDGIQGARIQHYEVVDVFHQIFITMKEYGLNLEDLTFEVFPPELPYPYLIFSLKTQEHKYEYYPVILSNSYSSEEDEHLQIENRISSLQDTFCNSNS